MNQQQRKQALIEQLAHFLVDDQAAKSIMLQMEHQGRFNNDPRPKLAVEWAKLRSASTLSGYPELPEAIKTLQKLLA